MRKEKILSENMENWKHEKGIGRGKKTIVGGWDCLLC